MGKRRRLSKCPFGPSNVGFPLNVKFSRNHYITGQTITRSFWCLPLHNSILGPHSPSKMSQVGQKKSTPKATKKIKKKQTPSSDSPEVEGPGPSQETEDEEEEHSREQPLDEESDEQDLPTPPASPTMQRKKQAQKPLNSRKKRTPKPQYQEADVDEDGGPLDDALNAPGQLVGKVADTGQELVQHTAGQAVNKAQDVVGGAEETVSGVTGALAGGGSNSDNKKEQLRLRLDLNLVRAARFIACDDSRTDVFAILFTGG